MNDVFARRCEYQPEYEQSFHQHEQTQVTMILSGGVEERVGQRRHWIGPLDLVVKPAGIVHADRFGIRTTKTVQISFTLTPETLPGSLAKRMTQWQTRQCTRTAPLFLQLLASRRFRKRSSTTDLQAINRVLAGVGGEFAGSHAGARGPVRPDSDTDAHWAIDVDRWVRKHYCESVRVAELASHFGVHRVSLTRAFRQRFGTTIVDRVRRLRVQKAASLLAEGDGNVCQIANDCGFADQSHLTRTFKVHTSLTPNTFRRLIRSPQAE